jgi:hypothetical protein
VVDPKRPPVGAEAGAAEEDGVAALAPPKRPPVGAEAGAAEEDGVAALAPAAPNSDEAAAGVEVAAPLVAVVAAPVAGVEEVGVPASDWFLKRPAAGALGVDDPAAPNRLDVGAAEGVAALSLSPPPKLNPLNLGVAAGCEEAGCAGVDPPRLKVGGLLAGVELGRALPPNSPPAGLGVSWEPEAVAGVAAPNNPEVGGVALLFASFEPAAPPKRPEVGVEVPAGLAPNKLDVVPDDGAAAGLEAALPNKPELDAPLAWLFCPPREKPVEAAGVCPNRPEPGGGPAGVVDGRAKVLFAAGVAAGVDEPVISDQYVTMYTKKDAYLQSQQTPGLRMLLERLRLKHLQTWMALQRRQALQLHRTQRRVWRMRPLQLLHQTGLQRACWQQVCQTMRRRKDQNLQSWARRLQKVLRPRPVHSVCWMRRRWRATKSQSCLSRQRVRLQASRHCCRHCCRSAVQM